MIALTPMAVAGFYRRMERVEFIAWSRSRPLGRRLNREIPLPCNCDEDSCQGWAWASNNAEAIEEHLDHQRLFFPGDLDFREPVNADIACASAAHHISTGSRTAAVSLRP